VPVKLLYLAGTKFTASASVIDALMSAPVAAVFEATT
jgi:hypothetical protein